MIALRIRNCRWGLTDIMQHWYFEHGILVCIRVKTTKVTKVWMQITHYVKKEWHQCIDRTGLCPLPMTHVYTRDSQWHRATCVYERSLIYTPTCIPYRDDNEAHTCMHVLTANDIKKLTTWRNVGINGAIKFTFNGA